MIRVRQAIYVVGLLFWISQASADEGQSDLPGMELLEFLGESEKIDGEWLDPLTMIELQEAELQSRQQEKRDND